MSNRGTNWGNDGATSSGLGVQRRPSARRLQRVLGCPVGVEREDSPTGSLAGSTTSKHTSAPTLEKGFRRSCTSRAKTPASPVSQHFRDDFGQRTGATSGAPEVALDSPAT